MDRDELIDAGAWALEDVEGSAARSIAGLILDAVEPLIRADEREHSTAEVAATGRWCREDERATMRAQVEALRDAESQLLQEMRLPVSRERIQNNIGIYRRILSLFDGGGDEAT
jgi:hypothetical protein